MKVYVLLKDVHEDSHILGVYRSRLKAENALERECPGYSYFSNDKNDKNTYELFIEEWEIE